MCSQSITVPGSVLRVLAIVESGTISGSAKSVLEFAREAKLSVSPRIELSILTFARGESDNEFTRAARAESIPIDVVREQGRFDRQAIAGLRESVENRLPDIVWTNAVKSHFLVRLSGLNKRFRWMAYHHGYTTTDAFMRMYNELDRWSLRGALRVVTVCDAFADMLAARGIRRSAIRVQGMSIRPSAADRAAGMAIRKELGIEPDTRVLLNVGRLSHEKGHGDLMRAVAVVRRVKPGLDFHVLVVGDGPEAARLKNLCAELGVRSFVTFLGYRSPTGPYYAAADAFVLPSLSEGSPNVVLEALDAGVPVIATAVGGVPEMLTDEVNGLLAPSSDPNALARCISRVLEDRSLSARLAAEGEKLLERYAPAAYFNNIRGIFEEMMDAEL